MFERTLSRLKAALDPERFDLPMRNILDTENASAIRTILDVGANVGQSVERFRKFFPDSTIHSFEPVKASYSEGIRRTQGMKNVHWHHLGISNEDGSITFMSRGTSTTNRLTGEGVASPSSSRDSQTVDIKRLETFITEHELQGRVDLLKSDTEGLDLKVMEGLGKFLESNGPRWILSEVGFSRSDQGHTYFCEINSLLQMHGYAFVGFGRISNVHHFHQWGLSFGDALYKKMESR